MADPLVSPITQLAQRLEQQPSLATPRVRVYPWRKSQALEGAPPRIVLYPSKGQTVAAASIPDGLCDVVQTMVADCWGRDGEQTWAILSWLIQALESQGTGTDGDPGFWWELLGADWETAADTNTQGEAVSLLFTARFTIYAVPYDLAHLGQWPTGSIDSVSQTVTEG